MQSYSLSILSDSQSLSTQPICLLSLSIIRLVLQCTACCQSYLTREHTQYKYGRTLPCIRAIAFEIKTSLWKKTGKVGCVSVNYGDLILDFCTKDTGEVLVVMFKL